MSTQWQTMDTAPKDGTEILIYWPDEGIRQGYWSTASYGSRWKYVEFGADGCGCCGSAPAVPTHWMPLPPAPDKEST